MALAGKVLVLALLAASVAGTDVVLATEPQTYELDCERGGCSANRPATLGFVLLALGFLRAGSGRRSSRSR